MRIIASAFVILSAVVAWQYHSRLVADYERTVSGQKQRIDHMQYIWQNERAIRDALESNVADYQKAIEESYREKDNLVNDLAAANKRLRIKVVCPAGAGAVESTGSSTVSAELDSDARQAYLDHRRAVIEAEAWMRSCSDTVVMLEGKLSDRR